MKQNQEDQKQTRFVLALGLIAQQAGSGKPFSVSDLCRDLEVTVPQFSIERRMFTFSAQRYEIEHVAGGRGRDARANYQLPEDLRNLLTEYKATNGTVKTRRFACRSDNRAKPAMKKQRFLLAKVNFSDVFRGERHWALLKARELLKLYGFEPATAMELLDFRLPNDRVFLSGPVRICSVDAIDILKGNHAERVGFLHLEHQRDPATVKTVFKSDVYLNGEDEYLLVKEIVGK